MILYAGPGNTNLFRGWNVYVISLTTGLPVYVDGTWVLADVTLLDSAGLELLGQTWPTACTYIAGSQGNIIAVLSDLLNLQPGDEVTVHLTINNGVDQLGTWDGQVPVIGRTF